MLRSLILLIFFIPAYSLAKKEVVLTKKLTIESYAKESNTTPDDIEIIEIQTEDKTEKYFIFYSKMNCGMGTCPSSIFKADKKNFFRKIGQLEGRILSIETDKRKTPKIITQNSMGTSQVETLSWVYDEKSQKYGIEK